MDERVYEVDVCAACLTQLATFECSHCGSLERRRVRFRVSRSQVLKQADPHRSLIERTVYFGCVDQAGHYYWDGNLNKIGRGSQEQREVTPWGFHVDGGLISKGTPLRQGEAHVVHHDDGWTALAFEDRSVDSRPGSWSVFCIPAILDGTEALVVARAAFPTIFARYPFDVVLAT